MPKSFSHFFDIWVTKFSSAVKWIPKPIHIPINVIKHTQHIRHSIRYKTITALNRFPGRIHHVRSHPLPHRPTHAAPSKDHPTKVRPDHLHSPTGIPTHPHNMKNTIEPSGAHQAPSHLLKTGLSTLFKRDTSHHHRHRRRHCIAG